ncbi:hypothetical protein DERP_013561 [Dermatophagoides pteronyssinus]|uniref:Transmembrane protein n=1 Tax=Dermatophagoides pteronyssinus TaxID=6956 RepID=A0ABQ8J5I0_DERPT|nr:hypothetical protein DERP_013561 [Dermatophagoides pteronyssinus]
MSKIFCCLSRHIVCLNQSKSCVNCSIVVPFDRYLFNNKNETKCVDINDESRYASYSTCLANESQQRYLRRISSSNPSFFLSSILLLLLLLLFNNFIADNDKLLFFLQCVIRSTIRSNEQKQNDLINGLPKSTRTAP